LIAAINQPVTHIKIQAIGYTNIFSDLHLALGLDISLVDHKNQHVKIGQLVITMVNYVFAVAHLILMEKLPTHANPSHWLYNHFQ